MLTLFASLSSMYDTKIKNLQSKLDEVRRSGAGTHHEIQELTTKLMSLESRNAELESSTSALQKRLNDVLEEMEAERRGFRHRLAEKVGSRRSLICVASQTPLI